MDKPNGLDGHTTSPTSAMQVSSSHDVFPAPGWNDGIDLQERPSPLPPIPTTPVSAGSSSSDDSSSHGPECNSASPVNSPEIDPPP